RRPVLTRVPGWRTVDIARATAVALFVVATAVGLWKASTVVLVVFLGVLFGLAISSGVDRLVRLHIPRGLGAVIVVVAVAWILALIRSRLPDALHQMERWASATERSTLRTITGHIPGIGPRAGPQRADSTINVQ